MNITCSQCKTSFEISRDDYNTISGRAIDPICDNCIGTDIANKSEEKAKQLMDKLKKYGYLPRHLKQSFGNFTPLSLKASSLMDEIKKYNPADGKWLFLLGKTGTGKDHIASAIGREYVVSNKHKSVYAGTMQAIMRRYRDMAFGEVRSETEAFKDIAEVGLLIIRDIGVKSLTDAERGVIVDILDHRYNCNLPVIVTGNVRPEMLKDVFDERVIDRMKEVSYTINDKFTVAFDWDSYREGKV